VGGEADFVLLLGEALVEVITERESFKRVLSIKREDGGAVP
jgi:hypothetical protein